MSWANCQTTAADKMYESLKDQKDVSLLSFSKDIIDMVDMNIGKDEDGKKVIGPLTEVRVAICKQGTEEIVENKITNFLKKSPFSEVDMENKNKNNDLRVYVHRTGKNIHECHVTLHGETNLILVSFFGEFKIEDVDRLKKSASEINWE
jgi:hypothetical protein